MTESMNTVLEGTGITNGLEDLMEAIRSRLIGMSNARKPLGVVELDAGLASHATVVKALP